MASKEVDGEDLEVVKDKIKGGGNRFTKCMTMKSTERGKFLKMMMHVGDGDDLSSKMVQLGRKIQGKKKNN